MSALAKKLWTPDRRIVTPVNSTGPGNAIPIRRPRMSPLHGPGIFSTYGGGAPFVNTYSCYFDAVNNYGTGGTSLNAYLGYDKPFTWSLWYKRGSPMPNSFLISTRDVGGYAFQIQDDGSYLWFYLCKSDESTGIIGYYLHGMNTTNWYHLLISFSGNSLISGVTVYQTKAGDAIGSAKTITTYRNNATGTWAGAGTMQWGRLGPTGPYLNKAYHDEWAFWDSDQSANRSSIYNSGTTRNLSTLSTPPRNWWRMGDDALDSTSTIKDQMGLQDITLSGFSSGDVTSPGAP